jgi:hypothetical protein
MILTALGAHFADEKKYPEKLTGLVPKYLKQHPDASFSGRALVYRRTDNGYPRYSVGPNGKEDGAASSPTSRAATSVCGSRGNERGAERHHPRSRSHCCMRGTRRLHSPFDSATSSRRRIER